ncbi:hypothetical protein [Pollutibacter soli]|uniref:hypothetical protein n=1 Tax=Pollutibacter soli TaxID=3034157 RepID=UPI003013372A
MENEEFRFGSERILSVWILHGTALFFLLVFGLTSGPIDFGNYLLFLFWGVVFIPHTYLYFNHLKYERDTVVTISSNQIFISKGNISKSFSIDDILEVQEYEALRILCTIIVKWKIIGRYDDVTMSSITYSRTAAWRFFGTKINRKSCFLPTFP